jgi:hypothetical protein
MSTLVNCIILFFLAMLIYTVFSNGSGAGRFLTQEGLTDMSGNGTSTSTSAKSGVAGGATGYLASIQAKVIQYQDRFLISKYRTDYENTVIKLGDLVDALMLDAALNVDPTNPMPALGKLNTLNGTRLALNNVIKYIDASH